MEYAVTQSVGVLAPPDGDTAGEAARVVQGGADDAGLTATDGGWPRLIHTVILS